MVNTGIPRPPEFLTHISRKRGQFRYFDQQLRLHDWSRLTVLDFGGNNGNFLEDAGDRVDPDRYWCLDVAAEAVELGRRRHPRAHWVCYDRYNSCFNPAGTANLGLPALDQRFDCILAYSVFTHIVPSEMQGLIAELVSWLADDGRLAFTFIDPRYRSWPSRPDCSNFQWRLERVVGSGTPLDVGSYLDRTRGAAWFALVNDVDLYIEDEAIPVQDSKAGRSFHVYHSPAFIRRLFPQGRVLEPVADEMQHCCILGR
jgi:SAM-dependent methyltransferase